MNFKLTGKSPAIDKYNTLYCLAKQADLYGDTGESKTMNLAVRVRSPGEKL